MLDSSIPLWNLLGVAAVGIFGWLSRQIPRRARLMARVERLGAAYAAMPESPQKARFKRHLLAAIEELDAWIEPSSVKRRAAIGSITAILVVVALCAALPIQAAIDPASDVRVSVSIGAVLGAVIAVITSTVELVWRKWSNRREGLQERERQTAEDALRFEAIARGESPGPAASHV